MRGTRSGFYCLSILCLLYLVHGSVEVVHLDSGSDIPLPTRSSPGPNGISFNPHELKESDTESSTTGMQTLTQGEPVSVSFKQNGDSGYLHDTGAAFGTHGDHEYGWMCDGNPKDQTAGVRDWGNHFDRYNECSRTTSWQMKVPSGAYNIKVTLPNGGHEGCKVQGESTGGAYGNFVYKKSITISDGTLTVSGDSITNPSCHSIEAIVLEPIIAPTISPTTTPTTTAPTTPTGTPTEYPTRAPTFTPTLSPTLSPTYFYDLEAAVAALGPYVARKLPQSQTDT